VRPVLTVTAISPSCRAVLPASGASSSPSATSAAWPSCRPKRTQAALSSVRVALENTAYFFRSAS